MLSYEQNSHIYLTDKCSRPVMSADHTFAPSKQNITTNINKSGRFLLRFPYKQIPELQNKQ